MSFKIPINIRTPDPAHEPFLVRMCGLVEATRYQFFVNDRTVVDGQRTDEVGHNPWLTIDVSTKPADQYPEPYVRYLFGHTGPKTLFQDATTLDVFLRASLDTSVDNKDIDTRLTQLSRGLRFITNLLDQTIIRTISILPATSIKESQQILYSVIPAGLRDYLSHMVAGVRQEPVVSRSPSSINNIDGSSDDPLMAEIAKGAVLLTGLSLHYFTTREAQWDLSSTLHRVASWVVTSSDLLKTGDAMALTPWLGEAMIADNRTRRAFQSQRFEALRVSSAALQTLFGRQQFRFPGTIFFGQPPMNSYSTLKRMPGSPFNSTWNKPVRIIDNGARRYLVPAFAETAPYLRAAVTTALHREDIEATWKSLPAIQAIDVE